MCFPAVPIIPQSPVLSPSPLGVGSPLVNSTQAQPARPPPLLATIWVLWLGKGFLNNLLPSFLHFFMHRIQKFFGTTMRHHFRDPLCSKHCVE